MKSMFNDKTVRQDLTQAMKDCLNEMWIEVNHFLFKFEVDLDPGDLTEKLYELLDTEIIAAPPGGVAITVKDYFVKSVTRSAVIRANIYERLPV